MTFPMPERAYDIDMLTQEVDRKSADNQGWVFGLPPGIKSEQWPLDPVTGYPLVHGFTLKLPEDYKVHGPDIVAISFFATAADQNDGGAEDNPEVEKLIISPPQSAPENKHLAEIWRIARHVHPRTHRMADILDYQYAVVLLTQAEFDGELATPPRLGMNEVLARSAPPDWLEKGAARAFFDMNCCEPFLIPMEDHHIYKVLGGQPESRLDYNRAIRWTPRQSDPNAGKAPMEDWGDGTESGYQSFYYFKDDVIETENYRLHEWAREHKDDHIGGTMRPVQSVPEVGPFYIGFEEYFGGYNFGGGNAQLDFHAMKFDWACG